jgi:hypothetical protein
VPRRARVHADAVVLGHRREAALQLPGVRVDHRGHPVDPPPAGGAAKAAEDLVDPDHQMRLVVGLGEPDPEPARMRQRADQHVGLRTPGRVVELEPVPLDLLTRRVLDIDMRPAVARRARLAVRAQLSIAQLAGEGLVAPAIAERCDLVEQRRRPHVLIVGEPLAHVRLEAIERVRLVVGAQAGLPFAGQVGPNRLAVPADMAGDGRDGPPPRPQRCDLHVFLWCQHRGRAPPARRCGLGRPPALGGAPPLPMDPQRCGISVSRSGEIRVSVVKDAKAVDPRGLTSHRHAAVRRGHSELTEGPAVNTGRRLTRVAVGAIPMARLRCAVLDRLAQADLDQHDVK